MAEHFAIWRAKFGVEWYVKPVFNDEEVIKRNKQVAEEIAAMGWDIINKAITKKCFLKLHESSGLT